jgi:pyrroline-5-carboxylate reductase
MPNTPALVGEGACGYALSSTVTPAQEKQAAAILNTFCKVTFKLAEKEINSVTALSGSGPAYFFYFAEAMLKAAEALGFDRKKAKKLVAQTMIGAGKMIMESADEPAVLRARVTSKGGTTQKAIESMETNGLKDKIGSAVIAAKKRADELGK